MELETVYFFNRAFIESPTKLQAPKIITTWQQSVLNTFDRILNSHRGSILDGLFAFKNVLIFKE